MFRVSDLDDDAVQVIVDRGITKRLRTESADAFVKRIVCGYLNAVEELETGSLGPSISLSSEAYRAAQNELNRHRTLVVHQALHPSFERVYKKTRRPKPPGSR